MTDPTADRPAQAPLAGHVVIELGHSVAAPFAGQILGDLGAQVIKVEKPGGDDARKWGPPFVDGASATFQALNRNKQSLTLDLRDAQQLAQLNQLIDSRADVVLQNMRPGQVKTLGLDGATLRARKPALVYCNLGAFGARGPLNQRPGYDPLMQAFSGIMSVVGEAGAAPVRVGPSIVDMGAGMWACLGIVSALLRRAHGSDGCEIDVSLFETAAGWMNIYSAQFLASGQMPGRNGSGQAGIAPYRAYRTTDGDLVVAAGNDGLFRKLCTAIGMPGLAEDPRYADNPRRVANSGPLYATLEACFAGRSNADWIAILDAAGVPNAPVQNTADMLAHPQTAALGMLQAVPGSSIPMIGLPISFDGVRPAPRSAAPPLAPQNSSLKPSATDQS